jgi:hypothetical protein
MLSNLEAGINLEREKRKNSCVCDENLLAGMKMFCETLTFCETSRKILDIYVSAALRETLLDFGLVTSCSVGFLDLE